MQRLPDSNDDSAAKEGLFSGDLPVLQAVEFTAQRTQRRADLMLDDACLLVSSMECRKSVPLYVRLFYLLSLLTLGTVAIVAQWPFCRLRAVRATSVPCPPEEADVVLVHCGEGEGATFEVCEVEAVAERQLETLGLPEAEARRSACAGGCALERRMIVYRHTRYLLRPAASGGGRLAFVQLQADEAPPPLAVAAGLSHAEAAARLALFGRNLIDVPIPHWSVLLVRECVHPFIVFQVWAVLVWVSEAYYSFSAFIFCTAIATAVTNLLDLLKTLKEIRRLSLFTAPVTVLRGGAATTLDSSQLVPGDVLLLGGACKVPADCVLLGGQVSVTEAMLTGEATVVTKARLPQPGGALAPALPAATTRSTLFCGTAIVAVRGDASASASSSALPPSYATAIVQRTGFDTVKGRLVLSILYPTGPAFKFLEESLRFIAILFALAMLGFLVNARALLSYGADWGRVLQRGADMVTIVVPPALPLAVTVGTLYALLALKKAGVSCISPGKVNVAGKVNAFCFDKTGTLTEEGLRLLCLRPAAGGAFQPPTPTAHPGTLLLWLLASCHSLLTVQGALAGDPLEVEVFGTLPGAELGEGGSSSSSSSSGGGGGLTTTVSLAGGREGQRLQATILYTFDFSPQLARMGTLVELPLAALSGQPGGAEELTSSTAATAAATAPPPPQPPTRVWSFVKGAPEVLATLCTPHSLPSDFAAVLNGYARRGLRVLGAAAAPYSGPVPSADAGQEELAALRAAAEQGLHFLGFLVLENSLKPQSAPTIARLARETGMPLLMVTGDNAVSAIAVSRLCGLLGPQERVFLGDLVGGRVVWEDAARLDPLAASPNPANCASSPGGGRAEQAAAEGLGDLCSATLLPYFPLPALLPPQAEVAAGARGVASPPPPPPGAYRLALTGRAFLAMQAAVQAGQLPLATLQRAVLNCAVAARMAPEAKAALVQCLQGTGLYVGMVGDGANDAMALKVAHVGVSLSTVEASVAAPFTSSSPSIEAIPLLLAEGRGALATSFCLFQFMALYSTIQFANALIAVHSNSFLSNNMYLYQDLWVVLVLALTLGSTPSASRLGRKRPSGRLFSAFNLTITMVFIATTFALQIAAVTAVQRTPWYGSPSYPLAMDPAADPEGTNSAIPETTTLFIVASFQFIGCALIFSVGHPWKKWPTSNPAFCCWLGVVALSTLVLTLRPSSSLYAALSLQLPPYAWSLSLLGFGIAAFLSYFVALGGVYYAKGRGWLAALECRPPPKPHKALRREWLQQWESGALAPARVEV